MVFEVVEFRVRPDMADRFIQGTAESRPLFEQAPGFQGLELRREVEDPSNFLILVKWESVQHHLDLQKTALHPQIRNKVKDCLAGPPKVRHATLVVDY